MNATRSSEHGRAAAVLSILAALLAAGGCFEQDGFVITGVVPDHGTARGGVEVTVKGEGFEEGAEVLFSGTKAAKVAFVSSAKLVVETPLLMAGRTDVEVKNPGGRSEVLRGGFTVDPMELKFIEVPPHSFPQMIGSKAACGAGGDFDRDGDPDVLVAMAGEQARLLLGDGKGNFKDADAPAGTDEEEEEEPADPYLPEWTADTRRVAAADFDGDGDLDVFACNAGETGNAFFLNDGAGHFADRTEDALPTVVDDCRAAVAGDINRDGKIDVVTVAAVAADAADPVSIRIYLNKGLSSRSDPTATFKFPEETTLAQHRDESTDVALLDVDGDGDLDIAAANTRSDGGAHVRIYRSLFMEMGDTPDAGRKLTFSEQGSEAVSPLPDGITAVVPADFDEDGDTDLVAIAVGGQDRLFINDGRGYFFDDSSSAMPVDRSSGAWAVAADMDRDAHLDLVIANDGAQNRIYLNREPGEFQDYTPAMPIVSDHSRFVLVLDVEGDGDQDILFLNAGGASKLYLSVEKTERDVAGR